MSRAECDIASLLGILSSSEEAKSCPLGAFARDIKSLLEGQQGSNADVGAILAQRSAELVKEEEKLNASKEMITVTYDKLRAEITRVEAQLRTQDKRLQEVSQQKKLCKTALNLVVGGEVPCYVNADAVGGFVQEEQPDIINRAAEDQRQDDGVEVPSKAAPEPAPIKNSPSARPQKPSPGNAHATAGEAPSTTKSDAPLSPRTGGGSAMSSSSLLALLRLPDVKESVLLNAIEGYTSQHVSKSPNWSSSPQHTEVLAVLLAVLKHLPEPRPPVQLAELRLLSYVLQAPSASSTQGLGGKNLLTMLEALIKQGDAVPILTKLLNSVNDDVKCDVLECLSPVVCGTHPLMSSTTGAALAQHARRAFLDVGGLDPLVNIVVVSTSEAVLERALIFLWGLLTKDERMTFSGTDEVSIRSQVRELGGLRAVLDLLYTDSMAILENVCMVIGYITREDASKKEIREIGGLEKITATLRHPSDSIKTKMAGAVWNCASNAENRKHLRELGAIPALMELLRNPTSREDASTYEFVRENAAGALWNLSVESENKAQIIEYGGIPVLIQVMSSSNSTAVVENVSGTLWNCSATPEARPVIRKAGGIPALLSLLNNRKPAEGTRGAASAASTAPLCALSEKVLDNVAGTLRNCAINDQNKPVIREAGGVELLVQKIKDAYLDAKGPTRTPSASLSPTTIDKLASTLWILTISPEIKHTVRMAGGIQAFTQILEASSPTLAGASKSTTRPSNILALLPSSPVSGSHSTPSSAFSLRKSLESFQSAYGPASLQKMPFAAPMLSVGMNIKEKLVGVLRNCSTIPENRPTMVECGTVRSLVTVIVDCYAPQTNFQGGGASHKNSKLLEPSLQLKESVASALWYLSRDDKVTPRVQGGLELMCCLLLTPQQPSVVLEQVAGALSSLTVNNNENREAIREHGGLAALIHLVAEKANDEYLGGKGDGRGGAKGDASSHAFAVLNALLTIRNCTVNNEDNVRYCADLVSDPKLMFGTSLLSIVEHGSEDCAKEAALTAKNLCSSPAAVNFFVKQNGVALATTLSERASSDSVRRAAASLLQALSKASRR